MLNHLKIIKLDSVDSTNKYAWQLALRGESEVVAVTARQQTQGHGRRDKNWQSPKDKGIYLSLLLRPENSIDQICLLPIIFALGVVRILKEIAPQLLPGVKIRWPNDVMVNGKKIAGVLVQARGANNKADFTVAGIGVNINACKDEIPFTATSLYMETAREYNIEAILKKLLKEEVSLYKDFRAGNISSLIDEVAAYQDGKKIDLKEKDLGEAIQLC